MTSKSTFDFWRLQKFEPLALILACAVVSVAAYCQALNYPFESDDKLYILFNTKLSNLHISELWRLFAEPYNPYEFLPLRDLSYWIDITLFGTNLAAFRIHNIFLYLFYLLFAYTATLYLWRYFRPSNASDSSWVAATVTALIALHPALVEPVVWISGRKDVLSTGLSLLAIWLAIYAKRDQGLSSRYAIATLFVLMAAILSKATAVMVAPVIALLWIIFWREIPTQLRSRSFLLWPVASLLLAAGVALIFSSYSTIREPVHFGVGAFTRSFAVLGWMARLAVSPESRHFYYPVLDDPHLPFMVGLGLIFFVAAIAGGIMALSKRSLDGFVVFIFFLLCIPYLQLFPYQTHSLVSDRFLSLAIWPAMLLIVAILWRIKLMFRILILVAIFLSWSFQTIERPRDWRSTEALFDSDLRTYPGYYMPAASKIIFVQLPGGLYREATETANSISTLEFQEAMIGLVKADYAAHVTALNTGNPEEAIKLLWMLEQNIKWSAEALWNPPMQGLWDIIARAVINEWGSLIKKFPEDESVHYNAGIWLLKVGKYEDATVQFRAAIDSNRLLESVRGAAFKNFGIALLNSGQVAEAESPLRAALEQSPPDLSAYCALSEVYRRSGRFEEATRAGVACTQAIQK